MNRLFNNLDRLESFVELENLYVLLKESQIYRVLRRDLEIILEYWKKVGQPPSVQYLQGKGVEVIQERFDDPGRQLEILIAEIKQSLMREAVLSLTQRDVIERDEIMMTLSPLLPEENRCVVCAKEFDIQEEYSKRKEKSVGLKFFVDVLDEEVGGLSYGTLLTIGGFVGQLKSTFALNMFYSNAKYLGYNMAFLTLEVPKEELMINLYARHAYELDPSTKITAKRIKKAMLTEEEEEFLVGEVAPSFNEIEGEMAILTLGDIINSRTGMITEDSFRQALSRIEDNFKLDAVFIDYVNLLKYFKSNKSTDQGVNSFIAFFHDLCVAYEGRSLVGIVLAQINREGWQRAVRRGGRYSLNALAEFNQLEQSSYYVTTLFYDEQLRASGEVKMQLLKHRSGSIIEEPFTTATMPEVFFVGDMEGYRESFTPDILDEVLL